VFEKYDVLMTVNSA